MVSTQGCSFEGRNARPAIPPEGWEQACFLVWWHPCYLCGQTLAQTLLMSLFFSASSIVFLLEVSHALHEEFPCSHVWSLFSVLHSSKRFIRALLCTQVWVNRHEKSSNQIVLCLHLTQMSHSVLDYWHLNWNAFLPPVDGLSAGPQRSQRHSPPLQHCFHLAYVTVATFDITM